MEASCFAQPMGNKKRNVSLHSRNIFYFCVDVHARSETTRFHFLHVNTKIAYIAGMEAIHFASCFPLSVWKRVVSLLARQHKNSIYCGNGSDTFRFLFPIVCVEASCFASCMHVNTKIEYIAGMEAKRFASFPQYILFLC